MRQDAKLLEAICIDFYVFKFDKAMTQKGGGGYRKMHKSNGHIS